MRRIVFLYRLLLVVAASTFGFLIDGIEDKISTCRLDIGVFTQPRSKRDIAQQLESNHQSNTRIEFT